MLATSGGRGKGWSVTARVEPAVPCIVRRVRMEAAVHRVRIAAVAAIAIVSLLAAGCTGATDKAGGSKATAGPVVMRGR